MIAADARALLVEGGDAAALRRFAPAVAAGFAETLEALAADGFARTPSFGLVEGGPGRAMIAVRGPVAAAVQTLSGERSIDADGVSTWLEQQVTEATAVALTVTGVDAVLPSLPLVNGIVWAASVRWAAGAEAPAAVAPAPAREPRTAPITAPVAVEETAVQEAPAAAASSPAADPAPQEPADAVAGETRIPDTTVVAEATIADAADSTGYDHLFGATMVRSVEDAAVRPAAEDEPAARIDLPHFITDSSPARASAEAGDHDGLTIMSGSLSGLGVHRSSQAAQGDEQSAAVATVAPPRFYVDLADGRREYLEPPIVVGRAPVASTTARGPAPRPVTVDSAERDISRSHTTIAVEGDTVVVTDLHSRNGTMIVLPGKQPQKLRSGEPTAVIAGTVVDLGSGVTLTVGEDA